jgi:hypothetical protein
MEGYRWMDGWMDKIEMDGWMDEYRWVDEKVDGWVGGWMDKDDSVLPFTKRQLLPEIGQHAYILHPKQHIKCFYSKIISRNTKTKRKSIS